VNSPRGLYVSVEEHPVALATRANRLRLSLDAVDVAYLLDDGEILEAVDTYLGKSKKVTLVVIDSVSALFGRSWEDAAVFIDEVVKIFRRHRHGIALCVMHVNGDGDMAGLQDAQHSTDCNLTISVKEEIRTIQAVKNRQGPAFVKSVFRMTDTGLKKL
jgi:predicted ATP-dependent serine protease